MKRTLLASALSVVSACAVALTGLPAMADTLNIFTWEGYVMEEDLAAVNGLLAEQGYDIEVRVIEPFALGPEQMYDTMRAGGYDVSFLTLNYIQHDGGALANLLQPINPDSPRLTNYAALSPVLTNIEMGMQDGAPLYIPFGGGAYGIWANMDVVDTPPRSVADLLAPEWKGRLSLNIGQIQPNISLALMALGRPAFEINDLSEDRAAMQAFGAPDGDLQRTMTALYAQVGQFWETGPVFNEGLDLVASYGPGVSTHMNATGANWQMVQFEEGSTVWLDTINFGRHLEGKKLEAAEIFANYFIGKQVQTRVVEGLGMVAASTLVDSNPLIEANPGFFDAALFWPPYTKRASNVMTTLSNRALASN